MIKELEKAIKEIGYKKYRINTEEHLLEPLQKPYNLKLKAVVTVWERKTIHHENMKVIADMTNMEVVIQVGTITWTDGMTYYKNKNCFVICLLEMEE